MFFVRSTLLVVFALCITTSTADAVQFSSFSQAREVSTTISEYGYADIVGINTAADFLPFNSSVSETNGGIPSSNGSANQNSSINLAIDTIAASGSAYGDAAWSGFTGGASVVSYSGFSYVFDVLAPSSYLFTGSGSSVRNVSDAMEAMVYADVYATLSDITNSTYLHNFSAIDDWSGSFNHSGVLQPARYRVDISGSVDAWSDYSEQFVDATATYNMRLRLAPEGSSIAVPEPAGCMLMLLGLAALSATLRRRFNHATESRH